MCNNNSKINILDVFPHKSNYKTNEDVHILVIVENKTNEILKKDISLEICKHNEIINEIKKDVVLSVGKNKIIFMINSGNLSLQGYGADVKIDNLMLSTSFDIIPSWSDRPRYGFLSDFYKDDEMDEKDINSLNKYHINVVQFYDWMYKHEDLIPKEEYFVDLLDRKLSRKAIKNKIEFCHQYNIKTLAYGAIYAASEDFYQEHKQWALYTNNNKPQNLGNWFYIMNISSESPWKEHIINEFKKAIKEFGFDGIHMDTYGFPKTAFSQIDGLRKIERLNEQFPSLINDTKAAITKNNKDIKITFNAVSNWAVEDVAKSHQDAVYIEVWDPQDTYYHLYQLVNRARELSDKQVILAAYMKCYEDKSKFNHDECQVGLLLTSATIFASGGFHFALGENNGVLKDPYYVNYETINDKHIREIRNYYDFIVRYGNLLFDKNSRDESMTHGNGQNDEFIFSKGEFSSYPQSNKVWTLIKSQPNYKVIQMINYTGIDSDIWNEGKSTRPKVLNNIRVRALIDEKIIGVYLASPDNENGVTVELEYTTCEVSRGEAIEFTVPTLTIWSLIYIEVLCS